MEDALALSSIFFYSSIVSNRLNPCCNGRCTRTAQNFIYNLNKTRVLILVVMEDALAQTGNEEIDKRDFVLILVVMEDALALTVREPLRRQYVWS